MAFIAQGLLQNRCHIGNEELVVGPFGFGNNWTKIRVGMRYSLAVNWQLALPPYGAASASSPALSFGVCAGKRGFTDPVRTLAIHTWPSDLTVASAGSTSYYAISGNVVYTGYRTATAAATASDSIASTGFLPKTPMRANMFMDITKSYDAATALAITIYYSLASLVTTDQTQTTFYEALHAEGAISGYGSAASTVSGWSLSNDLLNSLDCISVTWFKSVPVLEIFNIGVARFL